MTNKEKYEQLIKLYRNSPYEEVYGWHNHHIYPKSIWPGLADNKKNIISLPPIVHWYAHMILNEAFVELGHKEWADKLHYCCDNIAKYINKDKSKPILFSRKDEIIKYLEQQFTAISERLVAYNTKIDDIKSTWYKLAFVCVMGRCKDQWRIKAKEPNSYKMIDLAPMSLTDAKIKAQLLNVPLSRNYTDKVAEKAGLITLPSIREKFGTFDKMQSISLYDCRTTSPILQDLTEDCVRLFSEYKDLPDIFDL